MVCPYGWDLPGGVKAHIKELAEYYLAAGHQVSVIAPMSEEGEDLESYVVPAGRPVPIPFNGSVARILFGPLAAGRVRQWISQGEFDLLHLHEPAIPSLSLLACMAAEGPMVATFHAATTRQRMLNAASTMLEPVIEKLSVRIAVSAMAQKTLLDSFGAEAVIIPNGVSVAKYAKGRRREDWYHAPTIGFLGRFDEPRKGLSVLLAALPGLIHDFPSLKLLIAGPGDAAALKAKLAPEVASHLRFLGRLDDEEKADFFKSIDIYVAPNTGGESFGIILAEAMAAGTPIVASDIQAFSDLLGSNGVLFENESSADCQRAISQLLHDSNRLAELATTGLAAGARFDWSFVGEQVLGVYELASAGGVKVRVGNEGRWRFSG
jgi:phosphatidylinositol alpha-mannosyltransferase